MRIIYDYYGIGDMRKTLELTSDDRPYILEYLKENYPEWWYEPDKYPLPKYVTVFITNPYTEDLEEFEINTDEWDLDDKDYK